MFHCFIFSQSLIDILIYCIFVLVYQMFNTSVTLTNLPPLFCLAQKFHYISYRAVYFKAPSHVNTLGSLALARTSHYCLLIRTITYYLLYEFDSRTYFFRVYPLNTFTILVYKITHCNELNRINCFITVYCNDSYPIIDYIPHGGP